MPNSFPLLQRIAQRAKQALTVPAIVDAISNRTIDYATLYADICNYAKELEATVGEQKDLRDARVGILAEKGYPIVVALLATFAAGGLAIPLLTSLPQPEHHYMLSNGTASLLLHDKKNKARAQALKEELPEGSITLKLVPDFLESPVKELEDIGSMPELSGDRKAMMLFTSGTVSRLYICLDLKLTPLRIDRPTKGRRHQAFRVVCAGIQYRRVLGVE
jgi:malonyl-CoA/methylmalonyl-CoA synthetase